MLMDRREEPSVLLGDRRCYGHVGSRKLVNERKYGNSQTTGQPVVTLIHMFVLCSLSLIVFSCNNDLPISQLALLHGLLVFIERPKKFEGSHGHICFRR